MRLIALGHVHDELVGMGRLGRRFDLRLGGGRVTVTQVVGHAAKEQRRVLRHQGKTAANILRRQLLQRHTFEQNAPTLRVKKAQ